MMFEDIDIPELQETQGIHLLFLSYLAYAYNFLFDSHEHSHSNVVEQRMNWAEHIEHLERRGTFHRMYRMSLASFNKLVSLLQAEEDGQQGRGVGLVPFPKSVATAPFAI